MSEAAQEQELDLDVIEARCAAAVEGPWFKDDVEGEIRVYPTRLLRSVHINAEGEINVWDSPRTWRPEEMILETEVESWDEGENAQDDKVRANAEFIAHSREDVPALVAEVKRLRTKPAAGVTEDALADLRESIEQELELGGDASTLVPAVTEWLKRWPVVALSTQPAAGEVEWGVCDPGEFPEPYLIGSESEIREKVPSGSSLQVVYRTVTPWIEVQPEAQRPELAELFPGTLAALDNLSIRPEVQS